MTIHATSQELREIAKHLGPIDAEIVNSAADEIERLRALANAYANLADGVHADLNQLRSALRQFVAESCPPPKITPIRVGVAMGPRAPLNHEP